MVHSRRYVPEPLILLSGHYHPARTILGWERKPFERIPLEYHETTIRASPL